MSLSVTVESVAMSSQESENMPATPILSNMAGRLTLCISLADIWCSTTRDKLQTGCSPQIQNQQNPPLNSLTNVALVQLLLLLIVKKIKKQQPRYKIERGENIENMQGRSKGNLAS